MAESPTRKAPPTARRKLYGRRKGKALRASQIRLLEEVLPGLRVAPEGAGLAAEGVDPRALFGPQTGAVWLEIGFGGGEHLAHQAALHPATGFIGCEPFVNGVAMCLGRLVAEGLCNVRLHPGDARDLLDGLPDACLGRVFLLYPDPWPKARHLRRRFMNPENLRSLARVMRPGAELRLATDIPDYVEHALEAVARVAPLFEPDAPDPVGYATPWTGWPGTRYEAKAIRAGRRPHYLTFRRICDG